MFARLSRSWITLGLGLVLALPALAPLGNAFAADTTKVDTAKVVKADTAKKDTVKATVPADAVTDTALLHRIAALEAYVGNGDPTKTVAAPAIGVAGPGHNGFMMICAALVLFMTLPGLALFYGGLVRSKNMLSVMAQCMGIAGMVTLMWWAFGYSVVFDAGGSILGGFSKVFLKGVLSAPNTNYAYWVSENVFSMYQLMFAIITPGLILGAIAERMKFSAVLLFVFGWMILVYFPLAHMVWGSTGLMNGVWNASASIKAIDFAGGTVVHMSSGWSALLLCIILGKRKGFGQSKFTPHSLTLTMVGTGMLWVGWYGFNAGSAVAADGIAANAFMTTTLAAAIAGFVWPLCEWFLNGKPTVLGFCSGIVAGLVVITPATGFVTANGAVIIGVLAGIIPFFAVYKLKNWLGYDDALDTFGVHGVGGTLGALLTGFLATTDANANLAMNLKDIVGKTLWIEQLKAMGLTIALSLVATAILAYAIKAVIGLRPDEEAEVEGLDLAEHGEAAYHPQEG
jgi:ammonium transporter, Amt family